MTMLEVAFLLLFVAASLSAWLTRCFCEPSSVLYLLDHPNERSLHTNPTPRTGGIAIVTATVVAGTGTAILIGGNLARLGWLAGALIIVGIVSFVDDRKHLAPRYRIVAHLFAALTLTWGGFVVNGAVFPGDSSTLPAWAAIIASLLYIMWSINLYNFMDGMDGFAGGMAVIGFSTFAVLAWVGDQPSFALLNAIVAAAVLGFLFFNFPPARIFMGDAGSSCLGLLVAAFSIWGAQSGVFPFWIALLIFSPFIVDATVTLFLRLARGEKVWQPHRTHYYQRLVRLGWGHKRTVLWEYVLMVACAVSGVAAVQLPISWQWGFVWLWIAAYTVFGYGVYRLEIVNKKRQTLENV